MRKQIEQAAYLPACVGDQALCLFVTFCDSDPVQCLRCTYEVALAKTPLLMRRGIALQRQIGGEVVCRYLPYYKVWATKSMHLCTETNVIGPCKTSFFSGNPLSHDVPMGR